MKRFSLVGAAVLALVVSGGSTPFAAPAAKKAAAIKSTPAKPIPRYLPIAELKKIRAERLEKERRSGKPVLQPFGLPILQPFIDGDSLKGKDMKDLASDPPVVAIKAEVGDAEAGGAADAQNGADLNGEFNEGETAPLPEMEEGQNEVEVTAAAQVPPAGIRRTPAERQPPRWVRYPLEFQLCGIGIGTKAVDKDEFNRIDRYGLFAIHGNPTAVVTADNVTVDQQPPEVAGLFPNDPGGGLPDWAAAVTVPLEGGDVEWLYRRDKYAMGFVVDNLGYVNAIVVAGIASPIARTQLEDPLHTIRLGEDDLRKVLFRYGYPDEITTSQVNASASAGGDGAVNNPYRLFEFRYDQSYNIVFTIRNNRVVRMYILGDPDFFNENRRKIIRDEY